MKESIANSYIFGIVILFVGLIMLFFVASLNYTKAFKVKNRIINIIESNGGYDDYVKEEIEESLSEIGYKIEKNIECKPDVRFGSIITKTGNTNYHYCIYEVSQGEKGNSYGVVAYMYFEIPLIGETLEFPVYGETKTLGLLG